MIRICWVTYVVQVLVRIQDRNASSPYVHSVKKEHTQLINNGSNTMKQTGLTILQIFVKNGPLNWNPRAQINLRRVLRFEKLFSPYIWLELPLQWKIFTLRNFRYTGCPPPPKKNKPQTGNCLISCNVKAIAMKQRSLHSERTNLDFDIRHLNLHAILTALLMFERWATVFENAKN
jgi:hypothetical protein